jgi:hypothetical protein
MHGLTNLKSTSILTANPSHHSSTHSPSDMRYLPYFVTTFSAPYPYQYISCLISLLLQLFTPRNAFPLCGRKHFASAMKTQYERQSILHQHFHYNQHQHCFFSYVILLHVKIISAWFLGVFSTLRKKSISFARSVRPLIRPHLTI